MLAILIFNDGVEIEAEIGDLAPVIKWFRPEKEIAPYFVPVDPAQLMVREVVLHRDSGCIRFKGDRACPVYRERKD